MVTPDAVLVQRGDPLGFRPARWAWRCARTDRDHALLVSFIGRPAGFPRDSPPLYVGTAIEEAGALLVSVSPTPAMEPLLRRGRAVGRVGVVRVSVPGGWREREILDAATGRRRAVFDGAALLRPAESDPAQTASIVGAGTGDDRPSWRQWFSLPDGRGVTVTHIVDDENAVYGVPVRDVAVRGRGGTFTEERDGGRLVTRNLWWSERGATVHLRTEGSSGRGAPEDGGPLSADALLAFAEGLV